MRPGAGIDEGAWDPAKACGEPRRFPLSHLQEAKKQNQSLQQELAALRDELRAHGPGGEWPSVCLS